MSNPALEPTPAPGSTPEPSGPVLGRRGLLRNTSLAALAVGGAFGGVVDGTAQAMAATQPAATAMAAAKAAAATAAAPRTAQARADISFTPLRPPATPLAVRSPYLSTWLAGDSLVGTWSSFWNGHTTALCGIARIDGTAYLFAGAPASSVVPNSMTQTSVQLTATRSIFTFTAAGVTLTVTFFSPVEPTDLQRQSVPLSYVTVRAASADGGSHTVDVHLDVSAEWAHGDVTQQVTWAQQQTGAGSVIMGFTPNTPTVFGEHGDQASWGTSVLASSAAGGLTWQLGQDIVVRGASVSQGTLPDTVDQNQPRAINDNWPVAGLNRNLGTVTSASPSAVFVAAVGHVRTPALTYLGADLPPWWSTYWGSWEAMVDWFLADYPAALASAQSLEAQIESTASAAVGGGSVGADYAALCALAARQVIGGTELVSRNGSPWAFLKEISSDGNVSTVDVIYPAFPGLLFLDPSYLQLLLEPILDYSESGQWPKTFAVHDLGSSYPNAAGHNDGNEEDMPVEESANMLIMIAALLQRIPAASATAFAQQHYTILKQWADYLVLNALDPANQNQTDDFTGPIAHSANLALKGQVAIGAMSVISSIAGSAYAADQASYYSTARSYISQWVTKGEDPSGTYLDLAYGSPTTWSLKYNGFPDKLLGLNLVPTGIKTQEAGWYQSNAGTYGVILDPRHNYTKADWEIFTAAFLSDQPVRDTLIQGVYGFANSTGNRVPFSDWYDVTSAAQQGFQNRPVVGAMFAPALTVTADRTRWYKIQNQNSGKVLAVSGMSLADVTNVTQWTDNGTPDHLWAVVPNPDGTVRIVNRNSGKVLAVHNQDTSAGAFVQQYMDNGTPDHLWRISDAGNGWSKIFNVHSGLLMAVSGASTADGAQVTQWNDNGTTDHLWRLV